MTRLPWIWLAVLIGLATAGYFVLAPNVIGIAWLDPVADWRDRDCSDFGSWREAQDFYERTGPGDRHRLDRDSDGIACEWLR